MGPKKPRDLSLRNTILALTLICSVTWSQSFAIVGSLFILPTQPRVIWASTVLGRRRKLRGSSRTIKEVTEFIRPLDLGK